MELGEVPDVRKGHRVAQAATTGARDWIDCIPMHVQSVAVPAPHAGRLDWSPEGGGERGGE